MALDSHSRQWPGDFIVLEGIDGSGKSSVAALLANRLALESGRDVVLTREPGGTALGEGVRGLVLAAAAERIDPVAELLLFNAARAQHVVEVIVPALQRGAIVVCDRFTDSTVAYQWGGRGLPREVIAAAQEVATGGVSPDLRILLDLPVPVALTRRLREADAVNRFDVETTRFHEAVRAAYLALVAEAPALWVTIDASRPAPEVAEATYRSVAAHLRINDALPSAL